VLKQLPNGQVVSYQPLRNAAPQGPSIFDLAFNNMDYNGGPVMPSNTDYMLLWSPNGQAAYPAKYIPGVARYWKDLQADSHHPLPGSVSVDTIAAQYNDLTGASSKYDVTFGGVLFDKHPYPASQCPVHAPVIECMTDAQLQQEIVRFVTSHHLPTDLSHEYFLITPPHVETCFSNQPPDFGFCSAGEIPSNLAAFCAYHGQTVLSTMLFYADDPYVTGNPGCDDGNHPNNSPSDGLLQGGLSHEHNESITDPIPNDAWTNGVGPNHGLEVGDQCEFQTGKVLGKINGQKFNQVINGHLYWFQPEWSNFGHTCLESLKQLPQLPTATETVTAPDPAHHPLDLTFDATGSTAPGGVADYSWQFNDAFAADTVERTTPSITHTFPSAGAFSTGVAVFNPDGLSQGTGGIVETGHDGFIPAFTVTTAQPTAGQPVSFSALTEVSAKPVINYLWEFGDGTTGSGPTPTHTYASPGTYTVKAVLFSGIGSAFPGDGAAPVYAQSITVK
jgi:hypothetical protein